jgi:hypothetical protein
MSSLLDTAIAKIRSIASEYCENQMYVWPDFDPMEPDPATFFRQRGIEFDGDLFIRYPVRITFNPIPLTSLESEGRAIGIELPRDYQVLLQEFGEFHLPGPAGIQFESPAHALQTTRGHWCLSDGELTALAISPYNETGDGNSIGFVRRGNVFEPAIFEFAHELVQPGAAPETWTRKISDSLAEFILEYLDRPEAPS